MSDDRCACPHHDAVECAHTRHGTIVGLCEQDVWEDECNDAREHPCECSCHDRDEEDINAD